MWKQINQLRDEGYDIGSVPRKGYVLLSRPDVLTEKEVQPLLRTKRLGQRIDSFKSIESTNTEAKRIARGGCDEGTLVSADHQTGGRGRSGRVWSSSPGEAIQFSIVLRPPLDPSRVATITQTGAAAVAMALKDLGFTPSIKWPNDVILSGKKACGILTEMSCELDRIDFIVMGIGINVNISRFPEDIEQIATSLLLEGNRKLSRVNLMVRVLNHLEPLYDQFCSGQENPDYLNICRELSFLKGKNVKFEKGGELLEGIAGDIDDEGRLKIIMENGREVHLLSGEVHLGLK